ncbi:Protein ecdysoneless [Eumeta japonica]|uniref:Protein ecdysoneless n=1 Tax=Eumeta variegata TaxID=151549 RepID=A0A4C1T1Q2_EUMVA|nr:Protein ecdysoneless [Eumeta japonica]
MLLNDESTTTKEESKNSKNDAQEEIPVAGYKEDLLGVKLACGFEILASQAKDNQDDENSTTWKAYVRSLQAKVIFAKILKVLKIISRCWNKQNSFSKTIKQDFVQHLCPVIPMTGLYSAEQLDAMLTERYGPTKLYKSNGDINAEEFTKNIAEFLEKESAFEGIEHDSDDDSTDEEETASSSADADESFNTQVKSFLDFVIPEDKWDSNSEMSDYEDEDDLERNFAAMADAEKHIDSDIKAYMDQMDRELTAEDDFDDIEDFEPININVNTLKNMMDSYKSQIGGAGPVSNLLNAMGVGMSAAAACDSEDLKESAV